MKKVFISQPMRGKTQEEIMRVREKAIASAKRHMGEDVEIIESYCPAAADLNPLKCLAISVSQLADADFVYFAKDWQKARECRVENAIALEYELNMVEDYTRD